MAACNNCGAENSDDAVYCEDCGAQMAINGGADGLESAELEPGQVVDGRFRVEALIEPGPITRYRVCQGHEELLLLYSRDPEALRHQRAILQPVHGLWLFSPSEFFLDGERQVAVGSWPRGERLESLVSRGGPLGKERVERLARQILPALAELHDQGVISRAIQPSRIWVDDTDRIQLDLWDRAASLDSQLEETESIAVTPGFSAPEIYGLGQPGRGSDLFSLGAVLHYCLSGTRPNFEARETFFTVAPPPIEGAESLVYVIMRSLAKSPEERFPDALAMLAALDQPPSASEVGRLATPALASVATTGSAPQASLAPPGPGGSSRTANGRPQGVRVALKTDIGCVRKINQDACLELKFTLYEKSQPQEAHLVVVIDGMGGEAEGDKAASIALRTIAQEVVSGSLALRDGRQTTLLLPAEPGERCRTLLTRALQSANRNIYEYACLDESRRGMGCTITACVLREGIAHFAHVGDTRGYHLRDRLQLEQITTDHSLVSRLVAMGTLTPEEARVSPQRSIIYRALGTGPDVEVDLYDRPLAQGDRLVLCSDGVWEYFEAEEFAAIVQSTPQAEALCHRLVDMCLKRGADDNATLAVIDV